MKNLAFAAFLLALNLFATAQKQGRPNIILIMADDMGYSDLGCYGSEIPTPNIDALAGGGVRFTQFYNTSRCCPTRASLLTGLYAHQAGIGQMSEDPGSRKDGVDTNDWGTAGYQGYLNKHCITIAEALKSNGYSTLMAGKWHLGFHEKEKWPLQRGFDKFYGILAGAASYFKPQGGRGLTYQNTQLSPPTGKYYTTDAFTDSAIEFIDDRPGEKPFFLYLAFNAPHWPLHAKEEDIAFFKDKYLAGWDETRAARFRRQIGMGIFQADAMLSSRDSSVRAWEKLSTKEKEDVAYRMAVYAAQVKSVDDNVGKLVNYLQQHNLLENTLIMYLNDNGACAETYDELGSMPASAINDPEISGPVSYGMGWANTSNTPFTKWKNRAEEGGISTPFIMHWPAKTIAGNTLVKAPAHLIDVMPTILAATGSAYPSVFHNADSLYPLEGHSLLNAFNSQPVPEHNFLFWEHGNNAAVRKGDMKAIYSLTLGTWRLYDLANDRAEQNDVSNKLPETLSELKEAWFKWANSHFVLPKRKS